MRRSTWRKMKGAIWSACPITGRVLRVREGGEVTDVVTVTRRGAYACMLGGADRTTLFVCTADANTSCNFSMDLRVVVFIDIVEDDVKVAIDPVDEIQ